MDGRLLALVRAVESGAPGPPLRILVAGGAFHGKMVSSADFHQAMRTSLASDAMRAQKSGLKRLRRDSGELGSTEIEANVDRVLEPLRRAADSEGAVTLAAVKWWGYDNKTTLEMPAVRVPLDAISGWWVSGETGDQAGEWYVGVIFPFPAGT
jgi:hypothetical protein